MMTSIPFQDTFFGKTTQDSADRTSILKLGLDPECLLAEMRNDIPTYSVNRFVNIRAKRRAETDVLNTKCS